MIRQAEMRDLSEIEQLFMKLIQYLLNSGANYFNNNYNELRNGLMAYLCFVIQSKDFHVIVHENDTGVVDAFLIGGLVFNPTFHRHNVMCQALWMYPLSVQGRKLVKAFERWGRGQRATAFINDVLVNNKRGMAAMGHYGMNPMWARMVKEL